VAILRDAASVLNELAQAPARRRETRGACAAAHLR
jgi:hypothetical protein